MPPTSTTDAHGDDTTVAMRQGVPTRIRLDGVMWRFGIVGARPEEDRLRFSVLRDGTESRHLVAEGESVEVLGTTWTVTELDLDPRRLVLTRDL